MYFIRKIERLSILNKLIEAQHTGTPDELAIRLGIQRRTLFDWIDFYKSYGADIKYDRKRQTYYYDSITRVEIKFSIKVLNEFESKNIDGGKLLFSFSAFLPHRVMLY
jgi:hypothetical protein